ncbi:MAG: lipid-A-disaccharide synthase [Candidatus Omnitrophica bacterium]|nr:lipid-A-disaccharide synthase [Candidatus Omnitrophota bacterium]
MAPTKKILIICGEPSGDLHASNLVKDIMSLDSSIRFFGMGGSLCKKAGVEIVFDPSGLALIGLVEVLKNIFTVGRAYHAILKKTDAEKPDLAILVDYPGFNLRLAAELKKRSIPVAYYISPQVWAWGRDRVNIIKRCVKRILVFFKFEEELYRTYGIDAQFVGHPLIDMVKMSVQKEAFLKKHGLSRDKPVLALLPGSRRNEVRTLLPVMAAAAAIMKKSGNDIQFAVSKHPDLDIELYRKTLQASGVDAKLIEGDTYDLVGSSDLALVASGTATLETAIIGTPLVITYKVSLGTFIAYKLVTRTQFLGIVNIIAGKEIAPEFLQYEASPDKIAAKLSELIRDKSKLNAMRDELALVKLSLGPPGASLHAAHAILSLLS